MFFYTLAISQYNYNIIILCAEPLVYTNSIFGDGDLPVLFSNMKCRGNEDSFEECDKRMYGNFSCSRKNIAGVKCKEGMLFQSYLHCCSNPAHN